MADKDKGGNKSQSEGLQRRGKDQLARSSSWQNGSPFDLMRRFSEEMEGWFGHAVTWVPNVEVFQRGSEFVVRADLPGMDKGDVTVEIADDAITMRGERREEHEEEHDGFFRSERTYGTFYRVIPLPEGAIADTAKAEFKNGVLEITVQAPPQEVSRGRKLEIGEGSSKQSNQSQQAQQAPQPQSQSSQQQTAQASSRQR